MWALSFVPGAPTASFWSAVVIPCFVLVFPIFFVTVLDHTIRTFGQRDSQTSSKLNLPGWRGGAAGLIFVGVWLASATAMFGGHLSGQPFERDGRFFSNNHGVVNELTREQWAEENALISRLFAGGVLVFAGIAALSLTAPEPAGTGDDSEAVPGK